MAATACSGESLTVGENDASTGIADDVATADTGTADTATTDVATTDTGIADSGPTDTGVVDAGSADAGSTDADPLDAGPADAGVADTAPADTAPADTAPADTAPADSGAGDVPTDVRPPSTTGSLVVRLAGNPSNAQVTVAGPGSFTRTLDATTTLNELAFGSYSVTAPRAVLAGLSYVPTIDGAPATVAADAPAVVTVTYASMNTPPTIAIVAEQTLYAGALTPTVVPFTLNDVEDGPGGLVPVVTSSAPSMVTATVAASGSGWNLSLLPGSSAGSAMVTITVVDSRGTMSTLALNVAVSTAGVVTTNADSGSGSLRAAIAAVPAGATVTFAPSVTGLIRLNTTIRVSRAIIIQGPGAGVITIDGNDDVQLLYVTVPLTVTGLTFAHGYSGSYGAAIQSPNAGAPLTVRDCAFDGNVSGMLGGAIFAGSNLTLSRSTFTSNRSNSAGAVLAQGPVNTITGCTFRSNAANIFGGAVQAYLTTQHAITDSAFISNTAAGGGALSLNGNGCMATVTNCTFASNAASAGGSAVVINGAGAQVSMSFSTVTGSSGSPALHITTGGYLLKNSIVSGNTAGDFSSLGNFQSGGHNILGSVRGASFVGDENIPDRIGVAVALDPVSSYGGSTPTVRLPAASIAVDAIPAAQCTTYAGPLATDQRGRARPAGALCDIGAFERQSAD
jgi:predicted outer membrane repeat protein